MQPPWDIIDETLTRFFKSLKRKGRVTVQFAFAIICLMFGGFWGFLLSLITLIFSLQFSVVLVFLFTLLFLAPTALGVFVLINTFMKQEEIRKLEFNELLDEIATEHNGELRKTYFQDRLDIADSMLQDRLEELALAGEIDIDNDPETGEVIYQRPLEKRRNRS